MTLWFQRCSYPWEGPGKRRGGGSGLEHFFFPLEQAAITPSIWFLFCDHRDKNDGSPFRETMQFPWKNIHFRQTIKAALVGAWLLSWYYTYAYASGAWQQRLLVAKLADHPLVTPSPAADQQTTLGGHTTPSWPVDNPLGIPSPHSYQQTTLWEHLVPDMFLKFENS